MFNKTNSEDDINISLIDFIFVLARNFKFILIFTIMSTALTITYLTFFTEPVFTSTAKILSLSPKNSSSKVSGIAAQFGVDLGLQNETKWSYTEVIKSRSLARRVLKEQFTSKEYKIKKPLIEILSSKIDYLQNDPYSLEVNAVNKLLSMIQLSENLQTGVFTLKLNAAEPNLAKEILDTIIESLKMFQENYKKSLMSKARTFIEERITDTKRTLEVAEEKLTSFTTRNRRIENSPLLLLEQQRLSRDVSVLIGVYRTLKEQLETTKIEQFKESEYVVILDYPEVPLLKSSPQKKKYVIAAVLLSVIFGAGFSLVINYVSKFLQNEKEKIEQMKLLFKDDVQKTWLFLKLKNSKKV